MILVKKPAMIYGSLYVKDSIIIQQNAPHLLQPVTWAPILWDISNYAPILFWAKNKTFCLLLTQKRSAIMTDI